MFVNVGAMAEHEAKASGVKLQRIATKKLLKALLAQDIESVLFDQTSAFPNAYGPDLTASDIKPGDELIVVGPDPYKSRKWYANVKKSDDGKVVVS